MDLDANYDFGLQFLKNLRRDGKSALKASH